MRIFLLALLLVHFPFALEFEVLPDRLKVLGQFRVRNLLERLGDLVSVFRLIAQGVIGENDNFLRARRVEYFLLL